MKVLVTGGTGFVGSHSVRALLDEGHAVRLLVRNPARVGPALEPLGVDPARVEVATGDVTDVPAVRAALQGCQGVLHAASVYALGNRKREEMLRVNVAGTRLVLEEGLAAGCNPVVHVSSIVALVGGPDRTLTEQSPLGRPVGTYLTTKRDADALARALQERGEPVVISYPGGVWGPHDPYLDESCQMVRHIVSGLAPNRIDAGFGIVDVRDAALVHARAMKRHDRPARYPALGRYVTFGALHRMVCEAASVRRLTLPTPVLALRVLVPVLALLERLGLHLPAASDASWILANDHRVDNTVSERELGVTFRPVEEAVRDTVSWLAAEGHLRSRRALHA